MVVFLAGALNFCIFAPIAGGPLCGRDLSQGSGKGRGYLGWALALPVHDSSGALLSGAAYIFGGGNSASISTVQVIKPGHSAQLAARRCPGKQPALGDAKVETEGAGEVETEGDSVAAAPVAEGEGDVRPDTFELFPDD